MTRRSIRAALALAAALGFGGQAAAANIGQQVYTENCQTCHQATGEGRPPVFPALKGAKVTVGPKPALLALVLNGKGAMPPWKTQLSDEEVAAVTTYVRSAWGNKASPVTPAEVKAARAAKPALAAKP
jgi:cytochrome c oxidase subunit 2